MGKAFEIDDFSCFSTQFLKEFWANLFFSDQKYQETPSSTLYISIFLTEKADESKIL